MKKTLLLLLLIPALVFGQKAEFDNIFERNNYGEYLSKNGDVLKIGDTLQIGIATGIDQFTYISQGEDLNMHPTHSGKKVKITKIFSSGRKKSGYKIFISF